MWEPLLFTHQCTLWFFPFTSNFFSTKQSFRFCGHVELGVSKYQKAWHTRQGVNTEEKDKSAPLLSMYIYLTFATGRLAIRFSHITSRCQLCVGIAGYVKWQHSGWVCTDEMLWKCNSSFEDHTNMANCIMDLSNGNYRTELNLYSHFLMRWRWRENKTHLQKTINIIQAFYMSYFFKNLIWSVFLKGEKWKVGQNSDKDY